jgi:hypothetical protein
VRFDFDAARLAGIPVEETAPWLVLGLFDEATGHGNIHLVLNRTG